MKIKHGSDYSYHKGCRCDLCKLAHTKAGTDWRGRNREKYNKQQSILRKKRTIEFRKLKAEAWWDL